jgi:hypothetical protein
MRRESARRGRLGGEQALHGGGVGRVGGGGLGGGEGDVAGLDDGLEGLALVLEVALGDFDEVGDEVVTALQLDVDLGEGVLEAVAEGDEAVVDAGDEEGGDQRETEESDEDDDEGDGHDG